MTLPLVGRGLRITRRTRHVDSWALVLVSTIAALLVLMAIVGPWIAPQDPDAVDILAVGEGISSTHPLGVDSLGRDILSRALVGARVSFSAAALIVVISTTLGTALAMFSAWNGGWIDSSINHGLNVMFAVPGILVAVLASAMFGAGFWAPVLALGLMSTPLIARIVRSVAITERHRGYVEGLQLAGMRAWQINTRHVLPNVVPVLLAQSTYGFGAALADFAAVSFIGLGVQVPQAEWGTMVSEGRSELLDGVFAQTAVAGTLIVVTVVVFNVLGAQVAARSEVQR